MKRHMTGTLKDGTPKGRNGEIIPHANTAIIPSIVNSGLGSQNRIKSSRQSQKPAQSSDRMQRAITPKNQQKLYSSININKGENRGNSSKLQANYTQSMQNINQRLNTFNSEYL